MIVKEIDIVIDWKFNKKGIRIYNCKVFLSTKQKRALISSFNSKKKANICANNLKIALNIKKNIGYGIAF